MSWIISIMVAGLMAMNANPAQPTIQTVKTAEIQRTAAAQTGETVERFDQTYPLNAGGRISLDNLNGAVVITAWDKPEVRVEAVKTIDCDREVKIEIKIDANPNFLRIDTEHDWERGNNSGSKNNYYNCRKAYIDYKLSVPRNARLDQIETVNGSITLDGLTDYVKASTVNGTINAVNLRGSINVSSVNGTLNIGIDSPENVREIRAGMVNGTIELQLPSDIDATVKASTVNGAISNDFGLTVRKGEYVGRDLHGKLGGGTIPIKLEGVNGTINIRRKQDGRTIKTVDNFGPKKNNDNDDDDNDEAVSTEPPRPARTPRPPRVAVRPDAIVAPIIEGIGEAVNAEVQAEIRAAIRDSAKTARDAARAARAVKVDEAKIQAEVRAAMAEVRNLEREWNFNFDSQRAVMSERETASLAVEGSPDVNIDARGGSVSIRGWDKSEVSYSLVKRRAAQNAPAPTAAFQKNGKKVTLNVSAGGDSNFRLEVYVPRRSDVRVKTDGAIRVEGVKGELKLDGGEQSIDVRDGGGNLAVTADCGRIRVIGFEGNAEIKTISGDIALEGKFTNLSTDTDSGAIYLTLPENTAASLAAPNGKIAFDKTLNYWENGKADNNLDLWRVGSQTAAAADGKFVLQTNSQIYIRTINNIRVS